MTISARATASPEREPWAHVAHRNGVWGGAIAPGFHKKWKNDVAKFCGDFIADGWTITTVYNSDEYDAFIGSLKTNGDVS